jgi:hypothetical protein
MGDASVHSAMFSAGGKPELASHWHHRTAVGVTVDRDTDWWALARFEGLNDLWRNDYACSSLAVKLYSRTKFHHMLLSLDNFFSLV